MTGRACVPLDLITDKRLSAQAYRLLTLLIALADEAGAVSTPRAELAKALDTVRGSLHRPLAQLEAAGYVKVGRQTRVTGGDAPALITVLAVTQFTATVTQFTPGDADYVTPVTQFTAPGAAIYVTASDGLRPPSDAPVAPVAAPSGPAPIQDTPPVPGGNGSPPIPPQVPGNNQVPGGGDDGVPGDQGIFPGNPPSLQLVARNDRGSREGGRQAALSPDTTEALAEVARLFADRKGFAPRPDFYEDIAAYADRLDVIRVAREIADWLDLNPKRDCTPLFVKKWFKREIDRPETWAAKAKAAPKLRAVSGGAPSPSRWAKYREDTL